MPRLHLQSGHFPVESVGHLPLTSGVQLPGIPLVPGGHLQSGGVPRLSDGQLAEDPTHVLPFHVSPAGHLWKIWIWAGQLVRLFGSGGSPAGQQTPVVVRRLGSQQLPSEAGVFPAGQHIPGGAGGTGTLFGWHWLLLGPPGDCPLGQQIPVDVT